MNASFCTEETKLSFPLCWIVVNYLALAWVFGVYGSARHMSMTDDPFDDNVERSEQMATNQGGRFDIIFYRTGNSLRNMNYHIKCQYFDASWTQYVYRSKYPNYVPRPRGGG